MSFFLDMVILMVESVLLTECLLVIVERKIFGMLMTPTLLCVFYNVFLIS